MGTDPATSFRSTRWRSRLGKLFGVVVLLGLLAAGAAWMISSRGLDAKLARWKSAGLPVTARELNDFYRIPEGVADRTLAWSEALNSAHEVGLSESVRTLPILGKDCVDCEIPPPGQSWDLHERSRSFLADQSNLIQKIRDAASIPGQVRFPVDYSLGFESDLSIIQRVRSAARILQLDAHVSAHDRDPDRVRLDIENMLELSDALQGEVTMIGQLVRYAITSMAISLIEELAPACNWSDEELRTLQIRLQERTAGTETQRVLAAEAAMCLTQLNSVPLGPLRNANKHELLDLVQDLRDACQNSWPAAFQLQQAATVRAAARNKSALVPQAYMMVKLMLPSFEQFSIATGRTVAKRRMTIVGLAFRRHQLKHGLWPETLPQLDPTLLLSPQDDLIDPFTGKMFHYVPQPAGGLIYSLSSNGIDDQGDEKLDIRMRILHGFTSEAQTVPGN